MSIPNGWSNKKVADCVQNISLTGRKLPLRDYLEIGKYPVIDQGQKFIGGYTDQEDLIVQCSPPVIVFGDHTKAIKYVDLRFVAGADGIKVLKPLEFFNPKMFYYFLQAIELPEKGYARHYQFLAKSDVPIPPLAEQERIVTRIEELFTQLEAGVVSFRRVQAALKRYKASVLKAACEGRLVPQDPNDAPAEELLQRLGKKPLEGDDLPQLPERWCWTILSDVSVDIKDVDHKMPKPAESDIPYVSPKDFIGQDDIDFEGAKHISEEDYDSLCRKIKPEQGDILLSRYGTVGAVRRIKTDRRIQASYSIAIIKPLLLGELGSYLITFLRSNFGQEQMRNNIRASSQPDLGLGSIREFKVPLPPLPEQERIVAEVERRLSVAAQVEAAVEAGLKRAGRLRQAVLKSAFEGKLTA